MIRPFQKRPKRRPKRQAAEDDHQLFENLPDSTHMKNGSPILVQDKPGWSIKGLGKGHGRPRSAKQIVTTYEIVDWEDVPESVKHHFRRRSEARRALAEGRGPIDKKRKTCMLYLQADHLFYEAMGSDQEACIEAMTRHVQRVNSIYEPIDFDQDGKGDKIRFMIKRIKVHTEKALEDKSYRFPGNYGVEKFLEIFSGKEVIRLATVLITFLHAGLSNAMSLKITKNVANMILFREVCFGDLKINVAHFARIVVRLIFFLTLCSTFTEEDYDAFCLAYMFTYRDFEGGTLGLAWTGDMKNAGGVCERNGVSSSSCMSNAGLSARSSKVAGERRSAVSHE